jgi:hypothetical protein
MKAVSKRGTVVNRQTGKVVGWHETASVTLEGRTFTSGGAHVDPERAVAYMADDLHSVKTWNGEIMGLAHVVASWIARTSFPLTTRMYQVEAHIDGRTYTGRTAGAGMLWRGRVKRPGTPQDAHSRRLRASSPSGGADVPPNAPARGKGGGE